MNIKYILSATKNSWRISVRMYYGKFDLSLALPIFVENSSDWGADAQQLANSSILNEKLLELKTSILKQYNLDFTQGILFNKEWLKNVVSDVFNRPSGEKNLINNDVEIYFTDFGYWWIKNHSANWKVSAKKFISKVQISQYKKFLDQVVEFEKSIGTKLVLKDLSQDNIYELANWYEENGYNSSTIERAIGRLKFILNRSFEHDIKTSKVRNQRIYIEKEDDEIESVYLNEEELSLIHNHKEWKSDLFSEEDLEHAKDNLILSCYTSLRISDFMNGLDVSKIKENKILIRTQKTKQFTVIPLHNFVKEILNKRFGNIPKKFDNHTYNLMIKECCRIVKIEKQIFGKLWDKESKRKIKGYFPKWKYISSHCGRKSFISNLKGKISDEALMSIGAWKSNEMMNFYNKTTKAEYANELHEFWQNQNN